MTLIPPALMKRFKPIDLRFGMASKGATPLCGVYMLIEVDDIVYVGASIDIAQRLDKHLRDQRDRQNWPVDKRFNRAIWTDMPAVVLPHYEGAFIRAFHPIYNRTAPNGVGYDNEILEGFGLTPHLDEEAAADSWRREKTRRHFMLQRWCSNGLTRAEIDLDVELEATP